MLLFTPANSLSDVANLLGNGEEDEIPLLPAKNMANHI